MAIIDVTIPDIGDFDEVAVIELLVKAGDKVRAEQSLITVESDKASMEIPSSHAGVVKEMQVKLGDKVKQGSVVLKLETSDTAAVAATPAVAAPVAAAAVAPVAASAPAVATLRLSVSPSIGMETRLVLASRSRGSPGPSAPRSSASRRGGLRVSRASPP